MIEVLAAAPWVISALAYFGAPRIGRLLPGRWAAILLTAFALAAALSSGLTLAVIGLLVVAGDPRVAGLAHISGSVLRAAVPVPAALGVLAGAVMVSLLLAALGRGYRTICKLAAAASTCRLLGPAPGSVVVVQDCHPSAYALPAVAGLSGLPGRIIVTTGLLQVLHPEERRALLAHEAAHLSHRHFAYVQLAELAASANPLLRPTAAAVQVAVERWADDVAAEHTGDRTVVARTLAAAGLAQARAGRIGRERAIPEAALGAVDSEVHQRIDSLLGPRSGFSFCSAALVSLLTVACAASSIAVSGAMHSLLELAQAAYPLGK